MKKILLLFIVASLTLVSCKNPSKSQHAASENTVEITHSLGKTHVPLNPERIVALDFATIENLNQIGVSIIGMPKLAVPAHLKDFESNDAIENVGSLVEVNLELINELNPDLIIIGGRLRDSYNSLSKIAPTIITTFDTQNPVGALENDLNNLGKIFNKEGAYQDLMSELKAKIIQAKETIAESEENALVVLHNRGRFSAYGSGSRFGLIHDVLGVREAAKGLDTHLHGTRASSEFIKETNPDILFVVDRSAAIGEQALDVEVVENELIQRTNAYQNGKIIYLNSEAWYLSGTGGIESINMMIDEIWQAYQN